MLLVDRQPVGLKPGAFVGIEPEPSKPVRNRVDGRLRGPLAVGVLDPKHESTAVAAGEQPAEQGGAGAADMEESGGARRESGPHVHAAG